VKLNSDYLDMKLEKYQKSLEMTLLNNVILRTVQIYFFFLILFWNVV